MFSLFFLHFLFILPIKSIFISPVVKCLNYFALFKGVFHKERLYFICHGGCEKKWCFCVGPGKLLEQRGWPRSSSSIRRQREGEKDFTDQRINFGAGNCGQQPQVAIILSPHADLAIRFGLRRAKCLFVLNKLKNEIILCRLAFGIFTASFREER